MTGRPGSARIVAIDLGGTSIRSALVDEYGTLSRIAKEPVRTGAIAEQLAGLIRSTADADTATAVVGVPGRIDRAAGHLERARNLPGDDLSTLSADELSLRTGLRVELAGDAELACVGESFFGAGETTGTTGYLTVSTGLGAAVVAEGRVLSGTVAGFQIGFLPDPAGSGRMLDEVASGQRIQRYAHSIGRTEMSVQELLERADSGEGDAVRAFQDLAEGTAAAAIVLAHTVSPHRIVVGGGVALHAGDHLLDIVRDRIADSDRSHVSMPCEVMLARLGDTAGLAGAGAWGIARPTDIPQWHPDASSTTREGMNT